MVLSKDKRIVLQQKITKHAQKHTTIRAIFLPGCIQWEEIELPLKRIGQGRTFLVFMFVFDIVKNILHVFFSRLTHAVVELNALCLHKGHHQDPVTIVVINGEENLVKCKNVAA